LNVEIFVENDKLNLPINKTVKKDAATLNCDEQKTNHILIVETDQAVQRV